MKIIFWQNIISPHQSFLIKELAKKHEVILAVLEEISEERLEQGWKKPDIGNAKVVFLQNQEVADSLQKNNRNAVGVFSGIASYKIIRGVFKGLNKNACTIVIAEAGSNLGWQSFFRKPLYYLKALFYKNKIDAIFAMGNLGVDFYRSVGFPKDKIFRFQYFTGQPQLDELAEITFENENVPVMLFIGQLIDRKDIIKLLNVINNLKDIDYEFKIIGDGPLREEVENIISKYSLANKVTLHGNMDNLQAMDFLLNSDYLILPSKFDGWGAVVNEALSRGVKVITNTNCGASCIVEEIKWGTVYKRNSIMDLEKVLLGELSAFKRPTAEERMKKAIEFSNNHSLNIVNQFEKILLSKCPK
jgi:glycosyltransferase involved in cell wall biosynthesis